MAIVPKLTTKIVREAPFASGGSYYVMEGRSLRGFGIRVYRTTRPGRGTGRGATIPRFASPPVHVAARRSFYPLEMLPRNATFVISAFAVLLAVAWIVGLGWWSLPAASLAALVLGQIYHRLTLPARLAQTGDEAEWTVLYREEDSDWQALVGGERCTRREAETCRRRLVRRGYLAKIVSYDRSSRNSLSTARDAPA